MKNKAVLLTLAIGLTGAVMVGCTTDKKENPPENQIETSVDENKEEVNISKFIPNGNYETVFKGSDLSFDVSSIKGDGTYYQRMGTTGKGDYVEVFKLMNNSLINTYSSDFERSNYKEEFNDLIFFGEENTSNKIYLNSPIKQGTEWDKLKIVEVGKNLKLEEIQLEGDYVKVERDASTEDIKSTETLYFSQGLGIVKDVTTIDGDIVDYSELVSYEEIK